MSAIENILGMLPDRVSSGKQDQIFTPPHIAKEMVDALPDDIWNKDTTFLDICCKSGIFLYKIYEKLMESSSMIADFPNETERAKYIIHKQLFGIAPSTLCQMFSTRTVYGYLEPDSHIISFEDNYNHVMRNTDKRFLLETLQKEFGTMKFDVVIGNPPYNKGMDLDFVDLGYKVSSNLTAMITPAKWQTTADDYSGCASKNIDYKQFRKLYVPHMSHVCFYPDCGDAFLISQVDGITWYVLDKDIHDKVKITNKCGLQSYYNSVAERSLINRESLHNIGAEIVQSLGDYKRFQFPRVYMRRYEVWTNNQLTIGGQGGQQNYLLSTQGNHNAVSISRIIDKSKGETSPSGASNCIFSSDSKEECQNFVSWLNTRFTRFFVAINISNSNFPH